MIIYELKCQDDHTFEGWFNDRAAFEDQKKKKIITCPVCGSFNIDVVPSSITIMGKKTKEPKEEEHQKKIPPHEAIKLLHEYIDKSFEDVGNKFTETALKIHNGEENQRNIRGTTTREDEKVLKKEGVQFFKIPVPKFNS